jgi:hypothetical protein
MKKLNLKKAASDKLQAASLTAGPINDRIVLMCSFGGFPHDKFVKPPQQWRKQ